MCDYIAEKSKTGEFVPIKNSGLNGKNPPLYNVYWQIEEEKYNGEFDGEINFKLSTRLNMEYYKKHIEQYRKDRDAILKLSDFYKNESEKQKLKKAESVNERSFEIFGREKFFQQEGGLQFCSRLGIERGQLNFYDTAEPLSYYSYSKKTPQNILIIENKDTFFIKNNKGYKIYYKGRFVGKCKSLETFQGYRVYKNDKEAKENEEIK